MWIAVTKGERKLADLAARLYRIEAPQVRAKTKAATDALLEVNPELAQLQTLPPETQIVVPAVVGLEVTGETQPVDAAAGGTIGDELRASLAGAATALAAAVDEHERVSTATLELLGSREAKQAAAENPELRQKTAAVVDSAKAAQKDAAALRTYHERVLAQVQHDLDELLGAFES